MPARIRKRIVGIPFTVNGVTYRTRVGCHEVKSRYGRQAVLLRFNPRSEGSSTTSSSTALEARKMAKPLKRCTIAAVDSRGRFLVEEGGAYIMGAVHSAEEMANICQAELGIYEARKTHKPQQNPTARRKPNTYTKFVGAFLATFHAVSVRDASAAWRSFSKEEKKAGNVDTLIEATKNAGLYLLKAAPASS
jgi:hypothetical protein